LAAIACTATYAWTQQQYFVGADGDQVAVFRGVDTQFGPLKFFSVQKHTDLLVADLTQAARTQVRVGITASSQGDAADIVTRLRAQLLPLCSAPPVVTPTATATPTPTPTSSVTPSDTPSPGATDSGSAATDTPTPTITPRAPATPRPGVTCRTS
jgi:hypothetical protein